MAKMIQIRHVPEPLYRALKARAAMLGMGISDYLLQEIQEIAERPTLLELRQRLHARRRVNVPIDTAQLVRKAQQESREDR